jgi:CheY-like chemotaxis protein
MPIPGEILLACRSEDAHIVITVRDHGIGIDKNSIDALFEPFAQGHSGATEQAGLGIGLVLVRGLISLHGGSIEVNSDGPGKGSEFVVRLPASAQNGVTGNALADRTDVFVAVWAKRILLVDDLIDNTDALAMLVRSMGHEARTPSNGRDALAIAAEFSPEVILFDLGMPEMDGLEICRHIREQVWGKEVAVVALSGWGRKEDRDRTKVAGFDRHMTKPVSTAVLAELLSSLTHTEEANS